MVIPVMNALKEAQSQGYIKEVKLISKEGGLFHRQHLA